MCENAAYGRVIEAGKQGNTRLLDLGCCMGTDVRKAVLDGYPASNVIGSDLRREYIDLGLDALFADRETCAIRFVEADTFDVPVPSLSQPNFETSTAPKGPEQGLTQFLGNITHVYVGALFHLFDGETQYAIALRVALLMERHRNDGTEVIAFGRHSGLEKEGMISDRMQRVRYGHSPASWTHLWKRVFMEIEGRTFAEERVMVEAEMRPHPGGGTHAAPGTGMLWWSVKISGEGN
ncbi:hypothetical protein CONPUDRAFT_131771 [Coniophora puteana RWD-64-598 SS2]|uniref:Methyltransferase domain-containing protein n=1 Tax=Coniophora puteana (strain RWD-64-598) TaxID=741705 RepID=A0A5M3M9C3_CONPW|nr:uncharacterized protein CONPUDRAFT_131771 [Coniophora puteana RWD-64-598 SS2]EIW75536.1 hypothetical protein CONPUDRAFT_131771 [Coniophora puteana RWD-64-598 SS2]